MIYEKTIHVPASEKTVVDKMICDLCGTEIKSDTWHPESVEVKHCTGHSYPEGGSREETIFDLCGRCFDEKLVPWLCQQGAKPRTENSDW